MKFSIKDFFSKHDQIRRFLRIWSHLQKKSLMENLIFCAVTLKHYLRCLSECFFIEQLFLLFLRTIILFWCSKVHSLRLILPAKYLSLSDLSSQHPDSVILRKIGSSCIFTSSAILLIQKKFIKAIRRLQPLQVLNFQSSVFLKTLQYTESPNYLQMWPGIKVWSWY